MDIIGEAEIVLKYDGLVHRTFALVARGMDFTCLVAWHDLQPLQIISDNFPSRISAATSHDLTSAVVADFPSVFKDELGEAPMNVPKMSIHLTENYVPYRISTARQVPLRFLSPAEKVVTDLIQANVISPVTEPTEWCAPAFFVPKADGKKVRLVTDYTKLNKFVKRPVHPFPSVKEIVQSIPAGTRYFSKMDTVQGYFHLHEGLSFAKKIVDDILDLPTLYDRIRSIATKCQDLNIVLSKKKFEIGTCRLNYQC